MANELLERSKSGDTDDNDSANMLLMTLALSQYLNLRCVGLTRSGVLDLANAINNEKRKQLLLNHHSLTPQTESVDSFSLSVATMLDFTQLAIDNTCHNNSRALESHHRRSGNQTQGNGDAKEQRFVQDYLKQQCSYLEINLPRFTCLSYLFFEILDIKRPSHSLCYLRKAHGGDIFHTFRKKSQRRGDPFKFVL